MRRFSVLLLALCSVAGCEVSTVPPAVTEPAQPGGPANGANSLRALLNFSGTTNRLRRPPTVRPALVQLGQALAFDPILSGPKNISCMTCHQPALATTDGRSLSIGQGGTGVGPSRIRTSGQPSTPRNAAALFTLVGRNALFHDGRIELRADGNLYTPV